MTPRPAEELQRLLFEEPFVRSLARKLSVDPDDAVQQTWLHALEHRGERIEQPRRWLKRVVENVARHFRRSDQRRGTREHAAAGHDPVPSTMELAEREERRRSLLAAVEGLPDSLRTVVLLRYFEGMPPRRIAAKLGVPAATVSTQLHRGLELLRRRLDAEHGPDRSAWLLPLMSFGPTSLLGGPLVGPPPPPTPSPLFWIGAIAMQAKTKIILGAAVALLVLVAGSAWLADSDTESTRMDDPRQMTGAASARATEESEATSTEDASATEKRESIAQDDAPTPAPTTGTLVVRVRYGDDKTAAANVTIITGRYGGDFRVGTRRGRTDSAGSVTFVDMPRGNFSVQTDRGVSSQRAKLVAGETTEVELEMAPGLNVTGIVVDGTGTPISGALIEVAPLARGDFDPQVMATSASDGTFSVRAAAPPCLVGARAAGYSSSPLRFLLGKGNTDPVRLVLDQEGGTVDGVVVGPKGEPVSDATVILGKGKTTGIFAGSRGAAPIPALVRTDANGRFHALGIPAGEQPVAVRALGFAPWQGTCQVAPHSTVSLRIPMLTGATLRGVARDADGAPVYWADIEIGDRNGIAHYRTHSAKDGSFEITGLPAGELEVEAGHDKSGRVARRVELVLGSIVTCELTLTRGLELTGRVLDAEGEAVTQVIVETHAAKPEGKRWFGFARPDAEGKFTVANCPAHTKLTVTIRGRGIRRLTRNGIDPKSGVLELRVEHTPPPSVHIVGRVLDPDGKPVRGAMLSLGSSEGYNSPGIPTTGGDGRFDVGPLVPGKWSVLIHGTEYPYHRIEAQRLDAHAKLDLGEIRLVRGGVAAVTITGGDPSSVTLYVIDEKEKGSWTIPTGMRAPRRSSPLAPGRYNLSVYGKVIASQLIPFAIRAGEETKVAVRVQKGTAQRFEFSVPRGVELKRSIRVRIQRSGRLVRRAWASARGGEPNPTTVWLAPGRYEVTAKCEDLAGSSEITIGEDEKAPVQIELR